MKLRDQLNLLEKNSDDVNRIISSRGLTASFGGWSDFYQTIKAFVGLDDAAIEADQVATQQEINNFVKKLNVWKDSTKNFVERLSDSPDMQKAAAAGGAMAIGVVAVAAGLMFILSRRN